MKFNAEVLELCRRQFPALSRRVGDRPAAYFDGPGGTQVPQRVIDGVSHYLAHTNANHGGHFATSIESDRLLNAAHAGLADFLGTDDPRTVIFGQNMTSLTLALSRSLARGWKAGDEIVLTRLDHDANVTPWVLAARDAGAVVRFASIRSEDCTLDLDELRHLINERTRLVAVGCASNATGGINPVRDICGWAHAVGAQVFLDAVHYAPHGLIDVQAWGCDFLACSAYKFFGPHVGILWGRRELLERLDAYKVRPAPSDLPGKWMTGTQSHEAIAGALAAVEYLADLGRLLAGNDMLSRRAALREMYRDVAIYERELTRRLLAGLADIPAIQVYGITDPARFDERFATVSFTHERFTSAEMAQRLGREGLFAWHGNYYALNLTETLDLEPEGMLRIGLVHYNTFAEVERLIEALHGLR
ncbi:MAG: cysteine desulfurase-like protein [Pirellulaceae bacterium]|jgi:cysteine desulfurase family protein (TIGR01976 family)|nr:cysteine desulfurase-like protein [Pirellulaceae bacterium]